MNHESQPSPQAGPPRPGHANPAELKADIDSGKTGDKVDVFDPALSPLGTDDEAGGATLSPQAVEADRRIQRDQARLEPAHPAATSESSLEEGAGGRFSPAIVIGVAAGAALVAAVFAMMG